MVRVSIDKQGYTGHILLQPNISLSWRSNKRFIASLGILSMVIASYFTYHGFWVVMPFSGLEILFFAISIYIFFNRNNHREVLTFTADKVVIETGKQTPEKSYEYQRHWSQFHVRGDDKRDIPRLSIKSHGRELELGAFLGYDEKIMLIEAIKNITRSFRQSGAFHKVSEHPGR